MKPKIASSKSLELCRDYGTIGGPYFIYCRNGCTTASGMLFSAARYLSVLAVSDGVLKLQLVASQVFIPYNTGILCIHADQGYPTGGRL